ncbi:beta-lactamase-like protein 2-like protein [Mycotypha africana]|uniref:beta-lactamase-like protein 2-like protein n=1 Tax=Mycotypha africana TaxID=64632 RepID=UPI002301A604|nr:beta-lactamase-like protein 2-like protein [Mycotypha africana]KAI8970098.1 beta-lactamase-like protein 2-like protein [Mycotypha africana]
MTEALAHLPNFSQLSQRVWRVLGLNPGKFTLQGTNTYLLGTGAQKILLDCGEGKPEYLDHLETSLQQIRPDAFISDIIISHGHRDHWGGLRDILKSEKLNPQNNLQIHKFPVPDGCKVPHMDQFPKDIQVHALVDNQIFNTDEVTLKVIYTPGHSKDHCAFWLEEEQSLFTADCVLGHGTAVFDDLSEYLNGLQRLKSLHPKQLYPGHGPVIENGEDKIQKYIDHRLYREKQVTGLLKEENARQNGLTPLEIVQLLYKGYPGSLHLPAAHSIVMHLVKLQRDGHVIAAEEHELVTENIHKIVETKWKYILQ